MRTLMIALAVVAFAQSAPAQTAQSPYGELPPVITLTPKDISDFTAAAPKLNELGKKSEIDPESSDVL